MSVLRLWPVVLLLGSCSLLTEFDPAELSRAAEDCGNGVDDNADGQLDCADDQCWPTQACLGAAPLVRDPRCPRRERLGFDARLDDRDEVSSVWLLEGSSANVGTGVALGREAGRQGSMTSRRALPFGAGQRVRVELDAELDGRLARAEVTQLDLGFGVAPATSPLSAVRVDWRTFADRQVVSLTCSVVGGTAAQSTPLRRDDPGAALRLVVETEGDELLVRVGTSTTVACRASGLARTPDAPVYVAVVGRHEHAYAPSVRVTRAAVSTAPRAPECDGIREPLFAPGECVSSVIDGLRLADDADARPHVVATPGGWSVVAPAFLVDSAVRVLRVFDTADGHTALSPRPTPPTMSWATRAILARDDGTWQAYAVCEDCGLDLAVSTLSAGGQRELDRRSVSLDGSRPPASFPGAVVEYGGVVLAYWREPTLDGRGQVRVARSEDGAAFRVERTLVVGPSAWSAVDVGHTMAVARVADGLVLAYSGEDERGVLRVGLALSQDGVVFREHEANPVMVGEDVGLDDGGARPLALALTDGPRPVLRIWYLGEGFGAAVPCVAGRSLEQARRLALAELRP
jgi:hypothetical protein